MKTYAGPEKTASGSEIHSRKKKRRGFPGSFFVNKRIFGLVLTFLLGRVTLPGGLMPFGAAVFASVMDFEARAFLTALAVLSGIASRGAWEQLYISLAGMLIFSALTFLCRKLVKLTGISRAVLALASVCIPQLIIVQLQGFMLFDILKMLFYGFIVFTSVFIFRSSMAYFSSEAPGETRLPGEQGTHQAITLILAVSGLGELEVMGVNVKNIIYILTVLTYSRLYGSGAGAAVGVTAGILACVSPLVTPLVIGTYAFCGFLSGLFKGFGRAGPGLGFVMGNSILTLYMNGSTEVMIYLKEILVAIFIYLMVPSRAAGKLLGFLGTGEAPLAERKGYNVRIREMAVENLKKFSRAFGELSKTLAEVSTTRLAADKKDISVLLDRVAERMCKDCGLCGHCWERNFYNTYQVLFKIIERLDAKGFIDEKDIPPYFIERCQKVEGFVEAVNSVYEAFRVDMMWRGRLAENRALVAQQLNGLARAILELASRLEEDICFNADLEELVFSTLTEKGCVVKNVDVYRNLAGKQEVAILHRGCQGRKQCAALIQKQVSAAVGRKMALVGGCCTSLDGSLCHLKFTEEEPLRVTVGIARAVKYDGNVSGDNYTFMETDNGKYILALSDGMGSGHKAACQSRAAINLLEQFLSSGFDESLSVQLINSVLVLMSNGEIYATMDISVIDLRDGGVEFIKIGASPTYIKKSGKVEVVRSASLPAGIFGDVDVELARKAVNNGDFVIMMSDGVYDVFAEAAEERNIVDFLSEIESFNPQEIADALLNRAQDYSESRPRDDMLVLVAKIWKKVG